MPEHRSGFFYSKKTKKHLREEKRSAIFTTTDIVRQTMQHQTMYCQTKYNSDTERKQRAGFWQESAVISYADTTTR